MAKSKLQILKESKAYEDIQHVLYCLDRRIEMLQTTASIEDAATIFLQEEAAIQELRWQLHNNIRQLVWELEKI